MDLQSGQIVAERYELVRLLGEGGMGAVWSATHQITKKKVALKFLKASDGNERVLKRFLREARAVSAVNHPNVVAVHDIVQMSEDEPVMVMDMLTGMDLSARLARQKKIPLEELAHLLVPVISAVGTAHAAGIVHRDLKPDNIFLHERPDGRLEPKVLDFGIAKLSATEGEAAATAHLTQTGAVMGTPFYMPPEQVFGEKDIDQRADVWAMGVIVYECLSGQKPFDGANFGQLFKAITLGTPKPLEEVAPHLPKDVTDLVGRMLARERAERCPDLREAFETLRRYTQATARSFEGPKDLATDTSTGTDTDQVVLRVDTAGPVSNTQEAITADIPGRTNLKPWLAVGAAVVVGGISVAWWQLASTPAGKTATPEPAAPPAASATAEPKPVQVAEPSVTPAAESNDAAPAPSVSAAPARSRVPVVQRAKPPSGGPKPPAGSDKPEPPKPPETDPKPPEKLPGSVVGDVPF